MFLMFYRSNIFFAYVVMGVCEYVCSCVRECVYLYVCVCVYLKERKRSCALERTRHEETDFMHAHVPPLHVYIAMKCVFVYMYAHISIVCCVSFLYRSGAVSAKNRFVYLHTYIYMWVLYHFLSVRTWTSYSRSTLCPFPHV